MTIRKLPSYVSKHVLNPGDDLIVTVRGKKGVVLKTSLEFKNETEWHEFWCAFDDLIRRYKK